METVKYSDIIAAQATLKGVTKTTWLLPSKSFSKMGGCHCYLKLENMQSTGSFKVRGAYNRIFNLTDDEKKSPVVAASAGNHAQGVAYSSKVLGLKSTIFMPAFTPPLKVIATRSYGANVVLTGDSFDDAYKVSQEYCEEHDATYIHPFNDPLIIAGQGTVGLEVFQQLPEVDTVVVPIGGGGLISGVAIALKTLNPKIKIVGVEAAGAASMLASKGMGHVVSLPRVDTVADGIAVKTPGELTFNIINEYVDELVAVSDEEIAHTAYLMLERAKILAEPSGVASVAAVMYGKADFKGKNVVPIVKQGMMQEGLRTTIQITIPDQAGELNKLTALFSKLKVSVQDIEHIRSVSSVPIGRVMVIFTVNLQNQDQLKEITGELKSRGLGVKVLR